MGLNADGSFTLDDTPVDYGALMHQRAGFDEAEHPRDPDGKFASGAPIKAEKPRAGDPTASKIVAVAGALPLIDTSHSIPPRNLVFRL